MEWVTRNCPICDSPPVIVEISASIRADELTFEDVKKLWIGFRKNSCFFDYYRCQECKLLFNKFYFSSDQLEILYGNMPDNSNKVDHQILSKTQSGYLNFLLKKVNFARNSKYLELGPDVGLLTYHVSRTNLFDTMTLVEPNKAVHDTLNNSIVSGVEKNICLDFDGLSESNKFDLISGVHVFDHLIDPVDYIKKVTGFMEQGSYVLSVTHDEGSLLRRALNRKWPPFCLQHPQLYNAKTIEVLFNQAGLKKISIDKSTNWFPLQHIVGVAQKLLGLPDISVRLTPNINIPLKLGNMISLFQKTD
jgi:hypothetical protein